MDAGSDPGWMRPRRTPGDDHGVLLETSPTDRRPGSRLATWPAALLVGAAVGALTSPAQTLLGGTVLSGLTNAVGPWLLAPFVLGARARSTRAAVVLGVLSCVAQVGGYYAVSAARGFGVHAPTVGVWVVAGLAGGAVLGAAGRSWWTATGRWRGLGAALLVAAWLVEGIGVFGLLLGYVGPAVVSCVVGVALAVGLGVRGQQHVALLRWLAPAVAAGVLGFLVLGAVL